LVLYLVIPGKENSVNTQGKFLAAAGAAVMFARDPHRARARLLILLLAVAAVQAQPIPVTVISANSMSGVNPTRPISHTTTTAKQIEIHVRNTGTKNITYLHGILIVTPDGLAPVNTPCGWDILEAYVYDEKFKNDALRGPQDQQLPKGMLRSTFRTGEEFPLQCGFASSATIRKADYRPDTVIFADDTWSGDQNTAQNVFRNRNAKASDYAVLVKAVADAEASPDPAKRYDEILAGWQPYTGITRTPTALHITQTKATKYLMPYQRLQNYRGQYSYAARVQAQQAAAGKPVSSTKDLVKDYISMMLKLDIAIGAAYHIHSEAK
jgi:hypothetical protein